MNTVVLAVLLCQAPDPDPLADLWRFPSIRVCYEQIGILQSQRARCEEERAWHRGQDKLWRYRIYLIDTDLAKWRMLRNAWKLPDDRQWPETMMDRSDYMAELRNAIGKEDWAAGQMPFAKPLEER